MNIAWLSYEASGYNNHSDFEKWLAYANEHIDLECGFVVIVAPEMELTRDVYDCKDAYLVKEAVKNLWFRYRGERDE